MKNLENLLEDYKNGKISLDETVKELRVLPYKDLGFARVDHHRALRQGFAEVIFCPGKDNVHIVSIMRELKDKKSSGNCYQSYSGSCRLCFISIA